MLLSIFAIYDSGISTWLPPIYSRNKCEMMRQFVDAVNDPKSNLAKHPGDYTLFSLGTWDDDKCVFNLLKTPEKIGIAIEFVKTVAPDFGSTIDRRLPKDTPQEA